MILGLEIGLLIAGIAALIRGKMNFSKNKVVTGAPVYIAGVIMLLPMPVAFGIVFCYALIMGARGGFIDENKLRTTATIIEVSIVLLFFAIAMTIAGVYGKPPVKERRKKKKYEEEEYDDDEDDRQPRQRSSRASDEDDEDDEPRRRTKPRSERDVDEEDDRESRRSRREPRVNDRNDEVRSKRPPRRDDDRDRIRE